MPVVRIKDVREMSSEARNAKLQELRTELTKTKTMIKAGGAIENPGRTKALRRAIAQILTVINEEE